MLWSVMWNLVSLPGATWWEIWQDSNSTFCGSQGLLSQYLSSLGYLWMTMEVRGASWSGPTCLAVWCQTASSVRGELVGAPTPGEVVSTVGPAKCVRRKEHWQNTLENLARMVTISWLWWNPQQQVRVPPARGDKGGHHQGGGREEHREIIGLSPYYISLVIHQTVAVKVGQNNVSSA